MEYPLDDARSGFGFAASQSKVEIIQEPAEEFDGIGLVEEVEAFVGLAGDLLEKLVGGDVGFEGACIPYLPDKDGEPLDELGFLG